MNIRLHELIGYKIKTIDGEYGEVSDCLFTSDDFTIRYLVVDPQKWNPLVENVLISPVSVYYINIDAKEINLSIDLEKIKSSPQAEEHLTVSRKYEAELYQHYGYGYYWMGTDIWGPSTDPSLLKSSPLINQNENEAANTEPEDETSLRSIKEVRHYSATGPDNQSHVFEDFVFNTHDWRIHYAIIELQSGILSSELTVIKVAAVKEVSWHQQDVTLALNSAQLKANPHYEKSLLNSDAFIAMMAQSPSEQLE